MAWALQHLFPAQAFGRVRTWRGRLPELQGRRLFQNRMVEPMCMRTELLSLWTESEALVPVLPSLLCDLGQHSLPR